MSSGVFRAGISRPGKFRFGTFFGIFALVVACMQTLPGESRAADDKPQVMLIGVFHFANPGQDVVKTDILDVMAEDSQAYLQELSRRIVETYRPTRILLEYTAEREELVQGRYAAYLEGNFELSENEVYQLGFRIAKIAGGIPIEGFDDTSVGWQAEPLFEIMPEAAPEVQRSFQALIKEMTDLQSELQSTKTLQELLRFYNDPEFDRQNKDTYLLLNPVATPGNYEGAESSASWWSRNFRMYANVQRAAVPGERVLVIAGQGHTAILRDFLAIDSRLDGVDARPLF